MKARIVFLLVALSFTSFSQVSIGYRTHFGGMESYKTINAFYNANRPWLSSELSTSAFHDGIEIGYEGSKKNYGLSILKVYFATQSTSAKGTSNDVDYKRKVKSRLYGIEPFDFWYTPFGFKNFRIGGGVMPLALGHYQLKTKVNEESYEKPILNGEMGNLSILGVKFNYYYFSPHIDISRVNEEKEKSIHLQLFLQVVSKGFFDLYDYNQELNPTTNENFRQRTLLNLTTFGTKLSLNF